MSDSEERKFIHDLANAVGTALFVSDVALADLQAQPDARASDVSHLQTIFNSLQRAQELLLARKKTMKKDPRT